MIWLALALLSSAIFGVVAVMDKRLIDHCLSSLSSYLVWIGFSVLLYGIVFLAVGGIPASADIPHVLIAGLSGLAWGGAMVLIFWGYRMQEVSRASAVVFAFPVFVALMAVFLLDESIVPIQWAAMILVVCGAVLISLNGAGRTAGKVLARAFPILIAAAILTAVGHITSKYALTEISVWTTTSFRFFGMAAVLAFFWRPNTVSLLRKDLRSRETLVLLLATEFILVPVAILLMITATKLGPISLVATITGTRPVFILIYSTILSLPSLKVLNESLDSSSLTVKLVSVVMIIGGIVSLSLFVEDRFTCFCPY
jgi:drug/metabolite transporter (DMT)-like permease